YELVVALKIHVADIEENDAATRFDPFTQNLNRPAMPFEKRPKMLRHQRQSHHFTQRAVGQIWNDSCRQAVFWRSFNHQSELCRRLGQFDGRLRRRILRPINDVAPLNQVLERDRKSTRLNSSHLGISYAVFCLKKKNK